MEDNYRISLQDKAAFKLSLGANMWHSLISACSSYYITISVYNKTSVKNRYNSYILVADCVLLIFTPAAFIIHVTPQY